MRINSVSTSNCLFCYNKISTTTTTSSYPILNFILFLETEFTYNYRFIKHLY